MMSHWHDEDVNASTTSDDVSAIVDEIVLMTLGGRTPQTPSRDVHYAHLLPVPEPGSIESFHSAVDTRCISTGKFIGEIARLTTENRLRKEREAELQAKLLAKKEKLGALKASHKDELARLHGRIVAECELRRDRLVTSHSATVKGLESELGHLQDRLDEQGLQVKSTQLILDSLLTENASLREQVSHLRTSLGVHLESEQKLRDRLIEFKVPYPALSRESSGSSVCLLSSFRSS